MRSENLCNVVTCTDILISKLSVSLTNHFLGEGDAAYISGKEKMIRQKFKMRWICMLSEAMDFGSLKVVDVGISLLGHSEHSFIVKEFDIVDSLFEV